MNENKEFVANGFVYIINEEEGTASISGSTLSTSKVIIPTSIKKSSKEYIITSILPRAFSLSQIKTILFSPDSKLRTIHNSSFQISSIKNLLIPSSVIELEKGWCCETHYLNKIKISPHNPRYYYLDETMIIGKSSLDSKEYDILVFCSRNAQKVKIPSSIQTIEQFSFSDCEDDQFQIEIPMDSKLRTIEKNAFCWSSIKSLTIPSNLIELKPGWCYELSYLTEIYVSPKNPRYSIIEGEMIVGKSSLELDEYDTIEFCSRNAKRIKIPNYIKKIESYAFDGCSSLVEVEFPIDSKLQIINKSAFCKSSIYSLTIPSYVTKIRKNAFSYCLNLTYVDVAENSQLKTIEKNAFSYSKIEKFSIPSSLIELEEEWCSGKNNLINININENNPYFKMYDDKLLVKKSSLDSNVFDSLCICLRNANKIKIPNFIKTIESFAFYGCEKLFQVEIPEDSQLEKINRYGFGWSSIQKFTIPSNLKLINENAFFSCKSLRVVDFQKNSQLQNINEDAFTNTLIECFEFPPHLTKIEKNAFKCQNLRIIEINEKAEIKHINLNIFGGVSDLFIMIPVVIKDLIDSIHF